MKRFVSASVLAIVAGSFSAPSSAQEASPVQVFGDVFKCAKLAVDEERLACFDHTVAALSLAQQRQEIFVTDREEIREARRGLFGFSLPKMRLFGHDDRNSAGAAVEVINATITSVAETSSGGLLISLSSGARWAQTDADYVNRPKAGQTVTIRRGTMGGYIAKVGTGRAFRARRLPE